MMSDPETVQIAGEFSPEIRGLLLEFAKLCLAQYEAEKIPDFDIAGSRAVEKSMIVDELDEMEPDGRNVLAALVDHDDLAIRTSAATYLMKTSPAEALPVLRQIAGFGSSAADLVQPFARRAAMHARQALWMYEEGNLG